jgi:hypothetical protein
MITTQAGPIGQNNTPSCPNELLPSLLTATEFRMPASWHYLAFSKIHEIEKTGEMIEGVGDLRIQPATAAYARKILDSIHEELNSEMLPIPGISPISGGGIGILWMAGTNEVEAIIYPNTTASFLATKGQEIQAEDEFEGVQVSSLSDALRHMLQG